MSSGEYLMFFISELLQPNCYIKVVRSLTGVRELSCEKSRPTDAAFRAFEHSELFIPLAELIDPNEQRAKIEKDLEKLQLEMAKLEKKLASLSP